MDRGDYDAMCPFPSPVTDHCSPYLMDLQGSDFIPPDPFAPIKHCTPTNCYGRAISAGEFREWAGMDNLFGPQYPISLIFGG